MFGDYSMERGLLLVVAKLRNPPDFQNPQLISAARQ
jgi:hypothetical protein